MATTTISTSFGTFSITPSDKANCSKIDKRRDRRYGKQVVVYSKITVITEDGDGWTISKNFPRWEMGKKELAAVKEGLSEYDVEISEPFGGDFRSYQSENYSATAAVEVFFKAARPKEIISDEEAIERCQSLIHEAQVKAFSEALAEKDAEHQADAKAREANYLLGCTADEIIEKAKKNCNFEARLAALYAVLAAEVEAVATEELSDIAKNGIVYDDGSKPAQDVVDVVAGSLVNVVQKKTPSRGSIMISFSQKKEFVTPEDFTKNETVSEVA